MARTCFTEVKLSQARKHAQRYGHLGIGVHRDFVLQRHGNPVFYVQSGNTSAVVENLAKVRGALEHDAVNKANLEVVLGYAKSMSDPNSSDLKFYDELEWRIVHLERLEGRYLAVVDRANNIFRIELEPAEVRLVVFPDDETKRMALSDPALAPLVQAHPIFVTLEDCQQF